MTKKSFASIPWGKLPYDTWFRVVLTNPLECITMSIPSSGQYVSFKAQWVNEFITENKTFDIVFPYKKFRRALLSVPPELRQGEPVQFEFKKIIRGKMIVRNWRLV